MSAIFSLAIRVDPAKNMRIEIPAIAQALNPVLGVVMGTAETVAVGTTLGLGVGVGVALGFGVGVRATRGVAVGAGVT